jgi:hypothetical protein
MTVGFAAEAVFSGWLINRNRLVPPCVRRLARHPLVRAPWVRYETAR